RLRETDHRLDPLRGLYLGVVVEKEDILAVRVTRAGVVDTREVERLLERQHLDRVTVEETQRLRVSRAVVDEHDAEARIRRPREDRVEAAAEVTRRVLRRHDHRHPRPARPRLVADQYAVRQLRIRPSECARTGALEVAIDRLRLQLGDALL